MHVQKHVSQESVLCICKVSVHVNMTGKLYQVTPVTHLSMCQKWRWVVAIAGIEAFYMYISFHLLKCWREINVSRTKITNHRYWTTGYLSQFFVLYHNNLLSIILIY